MSTPPSTDLRHRRLAALLRDQREELLRRWTRRVLEDPRIPDAKRLPEPELRDQVPHLLDALVERLDVGDAGEAEGCAVGRCEPAIEHAWQRNEEGYGIAEALRELSHLRAAILELCTNAQVPVEGAAAVLLHVAIDETMAEGVAETERLAREAGKQLTELLEESHEAVMVWKMGGSIVSWNRGAEELYGFAAAEAIGQRPHTLLGTHHPVGMAELERILARDGRWEGELSHTARDGHRLLVESRLVVRSREGEALVLEMNRDVTERRQAEAARRETAARLRAIVDGAVDGILTIDERGTVESVNPATERLFGYRAQEIVGKNVKMLMPEPYRSEHDGYLARYRRTGERRIIGIGREVTGRHKNGATFPMDLAVSETWIGERRVFTGIVRDVTERRKAEQDREQVLESERAARTEAERAARLRDEFVATVSHELRSPLNAILGWTALLRGGKLDASTAAKAIEVVERNAHAQATLVEDLLDISRIGSGKLRLDVRPVNLAAVVENVIASRTPEATAKGVHVDAAIDAGTGEVRGDPARLEQIVSNLLSNAVKFTPRGGRVSVICRRAGSRVELIVHDTGQGIDPDFLPLVFDRFRQAEGALTRHHHGLGLGLALVKFLVDQHGGDVRAESEGTGRGATFTVTLPLTALGVAAAAPSPIDTCSSLAGVKALVVDDEEDARSLLRRLLEDCAVEVTLAASAAEALDELSRVRPDVLISDIGMPEHDGYHLIRAVRALAPDRGGRTPAVALTAFARPEDRRRAVETGFQMHLAKPVDRAELLLVVASVTGRVAPPPPELRTP